MKHIAVLILLLSLFAGLGAFTQIKAVEAACIAQESGTFIRDANQNFANSGLHSLSAGTPFTLVLKVSDQSASTFVNLLVGGLPAGGTSGQGDLTYSGSVPVDGDYNGYFAVSTLNVGVGWAIAFGNCTPPAITAPSPGTGTGTGGASSSSAPTLPANASDMELSDGFSVFEEKGSSIVSVWGNCTGTSCLPLGHVDPDVLAGLAEDFTLDGELRSVNITAAAADGWVTRLFLLGPAADGSPAIVFQINVYDAAGNLRDDSVLIFYFYGTGTVQLLRH